MEVPVTINEAARALRDGNYRSVDLLDACMARADALDPVLGVYVERFSGSARAAAARADEELASGVDRGMLHGIPTGIKDIVFTTEAPTTGNTMASNPAWNAERDATVVQRLREAGAVITGKVTTMELALGIPDESKPFPYPRNPWDAARWAGGSSSGSAAGVAAGMFLAAVGSDTGGSIRIPSSYCGITGLKPTFGLVPKDGVIPLGNSLDVVGPMTRDARDCATVLAAMVGDRGAAPSSVAPSTGTVHRPLRIGVDRSNLSGDHVHPDLPAVFDAAVADLAAGGASVVDVQVPLYDEVTAATIITWNSESLAYHRDNLRTQWSDFGFSVRTALVAGSVFSAADYIQAQKVRRLAQQRLVAMFEDVDIVVSPPVTSVAPLVEGFDQAKLYASVFTNYWSGVGNPVLNLPIGFSDDGLPFGVQVAGRWFEEDLLLAVGSAYQERTSWHLAVPDLAEGEAVA